MPRRRPIAPAAALAAILAAAPAQEIVLYATDPAGNPAVTARMELLPDAAPDVPALRAVRPLEPTIAAAADARGLLRASLARPALALVTTPQGLGAVVARAWPRRATRVQLAPMAALELGPETEVHAALLDAGGDERRRLPALRTDADGRVLLPPGRYELWWRRGAEVGWATCTARSGARAMLGTPQQLPGARALPLLPDGAVLRPLGAFDLALPLRDGAPLGLSPTAALGDFLVDDPTSGSLRLAAASAAESRVLALRAEAGPGARAFVLQGTAAGSWRVFSGAGLRDGRADLPVPSGDGNHWLLVTEPDRPTRALPLRDVPTDGPLASQPGRRFECAVRGPDGEPCASVAIAFEAADPGPAVAVAYTDELGRATLGPVAGAGLVRVDDARWLPASIAVRAEDAADIAFALELGAELHGRAVFADGRAAIGAAVSVRAPDGSMRPPERSAAAEDDGAFAFAGLDPRARLVLFATVTRDGHTWSGRATVRAGAGTVDLVLRDEDPQLGPPRDR